MAKRGAFAAAIARNKALAQAKKVDAERLALQQRQMQAEIKHQMALAQQEIAAANQDAMLQTAAQQEAARQAQEAANYMAQLASRGPDAVTSQPPALPSAPPPASPAATAAAETAAIHQPGGMVTVVPDEGGIKTGTLVMVGGAALVALLLLK